MLTRPDVPQDPAVGEVAAARAVRDLLVALGQDVSDGSLQATPRRVAATYAVTQTLRKVFTTCRPSSAQPPLLRTREKVT